MAVVNYTQAGNQVFTYTGVSASDTGQPIFMNGGVGILLSVHAFSGGGTGFNAGTLTIQVSNDNTNWSTITDLQGTDVAFTASGNSEISTGAQYIRPSCDASISDVDVIFSFG
jgi:hypothetical protein